MNIAIVYILLTSPQYADYARRFAFSYRQYPPDYTHTLIVVCNDHDIDEYVREIFRDINCIFVRGDNIGWDIGAYQMIANTIDSDLMVCLGSSVHFKRSGWLRRIWEAFVRHGDALYGASASFQNYPHFQTSAFWCPPAFIRSYHTAVVTGQQRYDFEYGPRSLIVLVAAFGYPCLIVNWDGEYEYPWRQALNCSYKGDQSNMLMFWNHVDGYSAAPPFDKMMWEKRVNMP